MTIDTAIAIPSLNDICLLASMKDPLNRFGDLFYGWRVAKRHPELAPWRHYHRSVNADRQFGSTRAVRVTVATTAFPRVRV